MRIFSFRITGIQEAIVIRNSNIGIDVVLKSVNLDNLIKCINTGLVINNSMGTKGNKLIQIQIVEK